MTNSPFDEALTDLRVSGSVLLHETYAEPWGIAVPDEDELRRLTGVGSDTRVLPFHLVRAGSFMLAHPGEKEFTVTENEVAICPSGKAHVMHLGNAGNPLPLRQVLEGKAPSAERPNARATSLMCGLFFLRSAPLNPLLAALPPLLKLDTSDERGSPILKNAVEMLRLEVGRGQSSSFSALRLIEVFCAEAIEAYRKRDTGFSSGWFRALDDKRIRTAIQCIHQRPEAPHSVARLASECSMSPSRFAARFREVMGKSVMVYVTQWRMNVACRTLRDTPMGLAELANRVGYDDTAAFSRAFKAEVGKSPALWRKDLS